MRVYTFKATDYRELGFFFDKQTAGIFPSSSTKQSKKKDRTGNAFIIYSGQRVYFDNGKPGRARAVTSQVFHGSTKGRLPLAACVNRARPSLWARGMHASGPLHWAQSKTRAIHSYPMRVWRLKMGTSTTQAVRKFVCLYLFCYIYRYVRTMNAWHCCRGFKFSTVCLSTSRSKTVTSVVWFSS